MTDDPDELVARVEVVFRPFVGPSFDRDTGPRGTEQSPYVRCILQTETVATNVHLMVGPVELEPSVRYETDVVFLNAAFALEHIREGERFRVPSTGTPMGYGRVLAWRDGFVIGTRALGDGQPFFDTERAAWARSDQETIVPVRDRRGS